MMMNSKNLFLMLVLVISFLACKEKEGQNNTVPEPEAEKKEVQKAKEETQFISMPASVFQSIYVESDYVDVIFEELPFSMSQDNQKSIQSILSQIDNRLPDKIDDSCPLFGQQVYQKAGEVIAESDIYLSDDGCSYFVFKVNGILYHNAMTVAGIQFYNKLKQGSFE